MTQQIQLTHAILMHKLRMEVIKAGNYIDNLPGDDILSIDNVIKSIFEYESEQDKDKENEFPLMKLRSAIPYLKYKGTYERNPGGKWPPASWEYECEEDWREKNDSFMAERKPLKYCWVFKFFLFESGLNIPTEFSIRVLKFLLECY